ncbi:MAG TPA: protein phosphatase CheZ [Steroidobacteraceae bacterium]|nr:protein phosphatase CheZ [Steroidobacteraceae bacterium]
MSNAESLVAQYGPYCEELSAALATGDAPRINAAIDALVQSRESDLFAELRDLTEDLQNSLKRFRLSYIANKEMPDARHRLDQAIKMADEAAHKTMDLIELSAPMADRAARAATSLSEYWRQYRAKESGAPDLRAIVERTEEFLTAVQTDAGTVRNNLNEVIMTQGYQDLSGQIIRGVMELVGSLETALTELVRLTQMHGKSASTGETGVRKVHGPVVPGVDNGNVVSGQQDVDSLLSNLGL